MSGVLWGRIFCGKICPIGYLQDLLYKIPFPRKLHRFKVDKYLRYIKYPVFVLWLLSAVLVARESMTDQEAPISLIGGLLLLAFGIVCVIIRRPFCKYLCPAAIPLGAFNLLKRNSYKLEQETCTKCGACSRPCKMDIVPYDSLRSIECVRCGKCVKVCPHKALLK
jgi:polyferredoxin